MGDRFNRSPGSEEGYRADNAEQGVVDHLTSQQFLQRRQSNVLIVNGPGSVASADAYRRGE